MPAFRLVLGAEVLELIQQPITAFLFNLFQNSLCGVPLEIGEHAREIRCGQNRVQVGVEDDIGMNFQAFMSAAIFERFD